MKRTGHCVQIDKVGQSGFSSVSYGGTMVYRISGIDRKQENQLWVVEAADQMTAAHIAELFRKEGYEKVKVEEQPRP